MKTLVLTMALAACVMTLIEDNARLRAMVRNLWLRAVRTRIGGTLLFPVALFLFTTGHAPVDEDSQGLFHMWTDFIS